MMRYSFLPSENEPCNVCPLSVYIFLLLQIPQVVSRPDAEAKLCIVISGVVVCVDEESYNAAQGTKAWEAHVTHNFHAGGCFGSEAVRIIDTQVPERNFYVAQEPKTRLLTLERDEYRP